MVNSIIKHQQHKSIGLNDVMSLFNQEEPVTEKLKIKVTF